MTLNFEVFTIFLHKFAHNKVSNSSGIQQFCNIITFKLVDSLNISEINAARIVVFKGLCFARFFYEK